MKRQIIDNTSILLLRNDFLVKTVKGCFDIVARKGSCILLIKVLEDSNALNNDVVSYMKGISKTLNATPLIISQKAGIKLRDNVIYIRYGIQTVSFTTLKNFFENKPIFIKSNKAGLTVQINGKEFKKFIEKSNISFNYLSKKLGVSKNMLSSYEKDSNISFDRASKFYEIFGPGIFKSIGILSQSVEEDIRRLSKYSMKYEELGFIARDTRKVPFDIVAKKDKDLILTKLGDKINKDTFSMSNLLEADDLVIFDHKKPKDIPSISKKDFLELEEAEELIKIVKERN